MRSKQQRLGLHLDQRLVLGWKVCTHRAECQCLTALCLSPRPRLSVVSLTAPAPVFFLLLAGLQAGYDEVVTLLENAEGRIEFWEAGERALEHAAER